MAGIMGLELFERFAMELNYPANTLTLRPLKDAPPGHGIPLAIRFTDDQPIITAKIDGIAGDNGLDTGDGGALVIQGRWAQAHGLADRMRKGLETDISGEGGISKTWAVRADLEVAGVLFPRTVALYAEDKMGAFSSRTEAGNIGSRIYDNFTLSFDYARNIVWFDPGPRASPWLYPRTGMGLSKDAPDVFDVSVVLPNSPAADAGIKTGDKIAGVNGTPARMLSWVQMNKIASEAPGTRLTLDVVHEQKKRPVALTLREMLP